MMAVSVREGLPHNDTSWTGRDPVRLGNVSVGGSLVSDGHVYTCHSDGAVRLWDLAGVMQLETRTDASIRWRSIGWLNAESRHVICCGEESESRAVVLAVVDLATQTWQRIHPATSSDGIEVTMEAIFGSGANHVIQEQVAPETRYHVWRIDPKNIESIEERDPRQLTPKLFEALTAQRNHNAYPAHNHFSPDIGARISIVDTAVKVTRRNGSQKTIRPELNSAWSGISIRAADYDGVMSVLAVDTSESRGNQSSDLVFLDQRNLVVASAEGFGRITAIHLKGNLVILGEAEYDADGEGVHHYLKVYGATTRVTSKVWRLSHEVKSIVEQEGTLVVATEKEVYLFSMDRVVENDNCCVIL